MRLYRTTANPNPPRELSTRLCLTMEKLALPIPPVGQVLAIADVDKVLAGKGYRIEERMRVKDELAAARIINR